MTKVIEVVGLDKSINKKEILSNISFEINKGDCVALIGPNGAGKTTLMNCLLGDYFTKAGQIRILGKDPNHVSLKEKVGVLFQDNLTESGLKVKEILAFQRAIYPNPLSESVIDALLGFSQGQKEQLAEKLSGGQRRLLAFVKVLIGQPDIIILDEPTGGMDTSTRKRFWEIINTLKQAGMTIIYSSHYIEEVEHTADRILLLHKGRLLRDTTPYDLQREDQEKYFSFPIAYLDVVRHLTIYDIEEKAERVQLMTKEPDKVLQGLLAATCPVETIEMTNRSLLATLFLKAGNDNETDDSID